jgi:RNA polymerase sigma-70 factor (ECF subfamily)
MALDKSCTKAWGVDYNTVIEQKEFYSILELCKSKLKAVQNAVFSMKYLDGIESEEICKELNITSSNYWVLIHRAKLQLRTCLEKNWFNK